MASPAAVLSVLVKADGIARTNSQLQTLHGDLGKSAKAASGIGDSLDKSSKKGSKALGALKSGAGLAAGAIGVVGLAGAVKSAVSEFQEARKVGANTTQVIKSTGGAANISAKQVAALATSISKKTGIDDEAIQSGSNLLLTFKNIRNEAGKGKDIFNQATKAAVDLSAAGFGDLTATSKQLGKALNDPVKGMTALGRSGVTFSEKQKTAIDALLKTGKAADRVKAQQIILKEVQSQVGGQAEAQATTMDKLRVTLGNLAEAAGSVLVPALDKVGKFLITVINQMIEGKSTGGAIVSVFRDLGGVVGQLATQMAILVGWFAKHKTVTLALAAALGTLAIAFAAIELTAFIAGITASIAAIGGLSGVLIGLAIILTGPVGIAIAIAAVVAAIVVAYRECETFRKIVNAAWQVIKTVAAWLITAGVAAFKAVSDAVKVAWGVVKTLTTSVWNGVKAYLLPLWHLFSAIAKVEFIAIRTAVEIAWYAIKTVTTTVWSAIKAILTTAWGVLKTVATAEWGLIKLAILNPIREARDALGGIWTSVRDTAEKAWNGIKKNLGGFAGDVKDSVLDGIKGGLNVLIGFVNSVIDVINKIPGVTNIKKIDKLAKGGTVSKNGVQALAEGGVVRKPIVMMGEEAPRHPEYVIPTNPAYRGRAQMLLAQAAGAIGYAAGGVFDSTSYGPPWTGINGTGTTATGVNLKGSPHVFGVAVDPSVIALGSRMDIWPNPFSTRQQFQAFDTGSAIKGRHLDFYDWRGRAAQYGWGSRQVRVGGGAIDPSLGNIAGNVVDALNPLDFINKLPGVGDLPDWLKGTGKYVLEHVTDWIKDKVSSVVTSDDGGHATGSVAKAIKFAQTLGFGPPSAQQLTGGTHEPGSLHYSGRAVDFGDAGHSFKQMNALFYGLYHKFGSNLNELFYDLEPWYIDAHAKHLGQIGGHQDHIHAAFAKGGLNGGAPFVGSYRDGGVVPRDGLGYLHQGETVVPRNASGGPLVHVENVNIASRIDENSFLERVGFKVATA